jgi:hypothetical protein
VYKKITDLQLIGSLKNNKTIYNALINIGLLPNNGNYERAKKLILKYDIIHV